jgi:metallophosphoesterase (TIGR03768 family)
MSNEAPKQISNALQVGQISRRDFIKCTAGTVACISFGTLGFGCGSSTTQVNGYAIDSTVSTTLERTVVPVDRPSIEHTAMPNDVADFTRYGYGVWSPQAGIGFTKRLDLMPSVYAATSQTVTGSALLLRFFTMTDIHLTDVQSPAETIFFGLGQLSYPPAVNAAYSPVIPYTTQVLDAAVQTVNALHRKQAVDFGLFLGDVINNAQHNELRWFIDILDGKIINPNSDPKSTSTTDYMRTFKAAGLDAAIKWYQVIGNHDHFWSGMNTPTDKIAQALIGEQVLNLGNILTGSSLDSTGYYMGVVDGSSTFGKVILSGPDTEYATPPKVNANPDRKFVPSSDWVAEFFTSSSLPNGHGFYPSVGDPALKACYSFEPKGSELPLKIIVLDNTEVETITGPLGANGYINQSRFDWLKSELLEGQKNGKLMIIAAHIPIGVDSKLWDPASTPTETTLVVELKKYSNLILWVAGHRHMNAVTPMPSPDPDHPELGFWEVETASLRDFPQQFRLFEIVRNSDNTISIFAKNVDPAVSSGSPAATSRSLAVAAYQISDGQAVLQNKPSGAYNVELVKQLSPEMQNIIRNHGTPLH